MGQKLVVDCAAGTATTIPLTPAEETVEAANVVTEQNRRAAEAQALADDSTAISPLRTQYAAMRNAIAADQAKLADAAWTPLTTAGKAEALRAVEQDLLTGLDRLLVALAVIIRRTGMP